MWGRPHSCVVSLIVPSAFDRVTWVLSDLTVCAGCRQLDVVWKNFTTAQMALNHVSKQCQLYTGCTVKIVSALFMYNIPA